MVGKRRGWDTLSAAYRGRLERAGITQSDYERGESIRGARGHAQTPERPTQRITREQFPQYFNNRVRMTRELEAKKERIFGDSVRWTATKSSRAIREHPPSIAELKWALAASDEEIYDAISDNHEQYKFLAYH